MREPPAGPPVPVRPGLRIMAVTLLSVYAALFLFAGNALPPQKTRLLLLAGGAYLLAGYAGAAWYDRGGAHAALTALFTVEILLGGWIVYTAYEFFLMGLLLIPLAGLSVWTLSPRGTWGVSAVLLGVLALAYGIRGGISAALQAGVAYLAALVFVVYVTRIARREGEIRTEAERLARQLDTAHRALQKYALQAEELAVVRERARLAHEIHDSVGHTLTALDFQLALLDHLPEDRPEQRARILTLCRRLVKDGLADARRVVQALKPEALERFSLPEAITELIAEFDRGRDIPARWQVHGEKASLPSRLAISLYRAAQEGLTNVQRHAPASPRVRVDLYFRPGSVELRVENAAPPAPPAACAEGGYGLLGLRTRAAALGGTFHAGPTPEGGFRLEMSLPLPHP